MDYYVEGSETGLVEPAQREHYQDSQDSRHPQTQFTNTIIVQDYISGPQYDSQQRQGNGWYPSQSVTQIPFPPSRPFGWTVELDPAKYAPTTVPCVCYTNDREHMPKWQSGTGHRDERLCANQFKAHWRASGISGLGSDDQGSEAALERAWQKLVGRAEKACVHHREDLLVLPYTRICEHESGEYKLDDGSTHTGRLRETGYFFQSRNSTDGRIKRFDPELVFSAYWPDPSLPIEVPRSGPRQWSGTSNGGRARGR